MDLGRPLRIVNARLNADEAASTRQSAAGEKPAPLTMAAAAIIEDGPAVALRADA